MTEELKATGSKAPEHPGFLVKDPPARPWEYRLRRYSAELVYAELRCIMDGCVKPVLCRMNAQGSETVGATICPTCGRKAYVRFGNKWFECG